MTATSENPLVMVDDNIIDTHVVQRALDRSQVTNPFLSFASGEEFLNYVALLEAENYPPPVAVLLDINMPQMSGFDVLEQLRQRGVIRETRIVMLTHSDNPQDLAKAQALGASFQEKFSERQEAVQFLESLMTRG